MNKPRLLLADDHALIIHGLRLLLQDRFDLVGTARDGQELVSSAGQLQPDIVVLDVSMPLLNGIEAARRIRKLLPSAKIVFVTQHVDRHYAQAAFQAGASGYVLKQSATSKLLTALQEVLRGRFYLSPELVKDIPEAFTRGNIDPSQLFGRGLTSRQREVLQLVAEGKSAKEVAAVMGISAKTVEYHKAAIMNELGIRTTAELTRYAIEHGLTGA